jgi:uncharacterized membrane protein
VFAALFVSLGKKYLEKDFLGKIWKSIFDKTKNFDQYFLGAGNLTEKNKTLNYAIFFLVAIVVLNIVVLWFNRYL